MIVPRRPQSLSGFRLIPVVLLLSFSLSTGAVAASDRPATPAGDIDVPPGGDLQAALDQARPGDTIRLSAGATYTGWFTLPAKGGSEYIVVRTNTPDADLPPPGKRVNLAHVPLLAKVTANAGGSVFTAAQGAHHYRFLGLEISPSPGAFLYNVVTVGDGTEGSAADQPHDIVFERCYIHGDPAMGSRRGIAMNGRNITIADSRISDFKEVGADSQALAGWSGTGPFTIVNNYLEGAGENIMFGGADPAVQDLVPADISVRHNHFFKPLSWRIEDPSYAGTPWSVKNLFELKNARRVVIEGNVFENDWTMAQTATAILFTVRNQDGTAPWSQIDHVVFRNNIVRHTGSGLSVLGYDGNFPSQQTNNVTVRNNLLYDLNASTWGGFGAFVLMLNGTRDVTLEHNTVFQSQHVILADLLPNSGFAFRNNIAPHNDYGVFGSGRAPGNDSLAAYFPGADFRRNVIPGAPATVYPSDNFYPANLSDVGFVDSASGNYRLSDLSPYRNGGTDGTDVGADIGGVEDATCGVVNGTYCAPSSRPPSGFNWPFGTLRGIPWLAIFVAVAVSLAVLAFGLAKLRKGRTRAPPPAP